MNCLWLTLHDYGFVKNSKLVIPLDDDVFERQELGKSTNRTTKANNTILRGE